MASSGSNHQQYRAPTPPAHSHHASSVPSTPLQHPRQLDRFHSRSPSPHRGLSNHSPRSVVSEAPGHAASYRHAPNVCKFETGAEIRKRRIPYVEGGNEELEPARKELKKTLEPDEHDKLSGDMRELYDRLVPTQESEERRARLVQKLDRILNEEWPGNDIRVNVFGSSGNLLSSSDSDVDICVTTPLKKLESMHSIAMLLNKHGMEKVVCRASAKVPIVKCWDPELSLACDLNVNNPMALENTRMIKTYVQLDDRVRPLAKVIKYWTKRRILNDAAFGGTISSYTWICMIISFLQRREPPVLPTLQNIKDQKLQGTSGKFIDDVESLKGYGMANNESQAELLFQFFRHYGYEFDYSKYVVSIRLGRLLSRKEKGWDESNYQDKEARNRLCVEEPFTTNRNLGNSADDYAWSGIHGEMRRAFDLLADGCQLEKACEQYEFPPEEKSIFQRPAPKPKPTLTRSASQSGRPNNELGSGRSRKGANRNQSAQRAGNRRASSGATFSNQRVPLGFQSAPLGSSMMDYFGIASRGGDLHTQLVQQYQYLQAQQDALRAHLSQQQAQQQQSHSSKSQSQSRSSDMTSSPHRRPFPNGFPSPRFQDNPPQTAPLLPGYLYHYPARYVPSSPMSQARSREGGSSTSPSSPSLLAAVPALRRQVHRASVTDGSSSSARSRSQPGRSIPHPLALQQQAHPGYDVSGALGGQYGNLRSGAPLYPQAAPPMPQLPFPPQGGAPPSNMPQMDTVLPKQYLGYYLDQSPSLGPQYAAVNQMPMPAMTLRDPPLQRPRRVTPDLPATLRNGRKESRSPSPLGLMPKQSQPNIGDLPPARSNTLQNSQTPEPFPSLEEVPLPPHAIDLGGPLIVNGSTFVTEKSPNQTGVARVDAPATFDDGSQHVSGLDLSRIPTLRPQDDEGNSRTSLSEQPHTVDTVPVSPANVTSTAKFKPGPKLNLGTHGTPQRSNGMPEPFQESPSTVTKAPLLSPVAELRTPSPTHSIAFDKDSPQRNGLGRAAKLANARQAESIENKPPTSPKHERKGSAPNPVTPISPNCAPLLRTEVEKEKNVWQQATGKKGHKKSKSLVGAKSGASGGQPLPINETDRKGG